MGVNCVMAAALLLSADGPGSTFTVGGGGAAGAPGNGLGAAAGPASWNRSLDRALEEAAANGCLNLSGRKLKEFPRSAVNHDLTDTTRADLSRNRLPELPVEVCTFVSLESLNLHQNCLRSLPEGLVHLQALTYLNISRNQLSTLPAPVCSLPLKDVSCNEIQVLPPQVGQLEALRDLNIRRNNLVRLPPELAELPLVRLDFSCNKVTSIPVCYRNLRHLQSIVLDNNPLQSPPAQICIKGKIHIFKYLNMEACKTAASDLPDFDRRALAFGSCVEELYPGRPYGALDSGFNSVDSGDKRWSGNEPTEELVDLPLRVAEITKQQRQRREKEREEGRPGALNGTFKSFSHHVTASFTVEAELEQIDYIDSCTGEEEEEPRRRGAESVSLSSQFMAYIERRIGREGSPAKSSFSREGRTEESRRHSALQSRNVLDGVSSPQSPSAAAHGQLCADEPVGSGSAVESMRREAQLAAQRYEEERQRVRVQREVVSTCTKHKAAQSPTKLSPTDSENTCPSRRSTHTDDSALFMAAELPGATLCLSQLGEERSPLSPTALQSPSYPGPAAPTSCRGTAPRPESFLFRLSQREERKRECGTSQTKAEETHLSEPQSPVGAELELVEQLRKNIESRLKVSLPSDLGAALTDGVVLCHLANHVRPRSVPSIHVPSPAVPKLTMAKCRRNVENFLEACRKMGVPQASLCLPLHILEERGLPQVAGTVQALLELAPPKHPSVPPVGTYAM
ncbi:leucine-rich repeat and calponin-like domain-containing protein 3-like [Scleropages formosus]|uniref:Leucine-rich repeat and calponin-like domain-containing protein 3-like n=1 Tax=Scleropages formosus TaxID=113540 RepID=A0A0P7U627_SCLFO|nr:leucine-rich repeat and calponin-like domain-containing protein 3-like [Scleropages formosus]